MNVNQPAPPERRNLVTKRIHGRQVLWQVAVPIVIGSILVVVLAVMVGFSGTEEINVWADISLILMLVPVIVVSLLFLAVFLAANYGLLSLLRVLPIYTFRAQEFLTGVVRIVRRASDLAAEPIIRSQSFMATLREIRRKLRG